MDSTSSRRSGSTPGGVMLQEQDLSASTDEPPGFSDHLDCTGLTVTYLFTCLMTKNCVLLSIRPATADR